MQRRPLCSVLRRNAGDPCRLQQGSRQVDAPDAGVVDDVARDIGELEGDAQVGGAIEHGRIPDAHDHRHHDPDDPGDMIAVVQHILDRFVAAVLDVHGESGQQFLGMAGRDVRAPGDAPQRYKDRIAGGAGLQRVGRLLPQLGQPRLLADPEVRFLRLPQRLAVDHVVAMAAPGVEHDAIVPGRLVEQPRRGGKALGALPHRRFTEFDNLVGHCWRSPIISPAVALAEPTTPGMPAPGCVPAPTM